MPSGARPFRGAGGGDAFRGAGAVGAGSSVRPTFGRAAARYSPPPSATPPPPRPRRGRDRRRELRRTCLAPRPSSASPRSSAAPGPAPARAARAGNPSTSPGGGWTILGHRRPRRQRRRRSSRTRGPAAGFRPGDRQPHRRFLRRAATLGRWTTPAERPAWPSVSRLPAPSASGQRAAADMFRTSRTCRSRTLARRMRAIARNLVVEPVTTAFTICRARDSTATRVVTGCQPAPTARNRLSRNPQHAELHRGAPVGFRRGDEPLAAAALGGAAAEDRRPGAGAASPQRRAAPQAEPFAPLPRQERRAAARTCWSRASPWSARPAGGPSTCGISTCRSSAASPCSTARSSRCRPAKERRLRATLPMYLHGLMGRGCHLATVNDYLARRDADWMGPIYQLLGMSVGVVETPDVAAAAAQGLRLRRHLRHGQGVRLRFPPRPAPAAADQRGANRPAGRHVGPGARGAPTKSPSRASRTSPWSTRPTAS